MYMCSSVSDAQKLLPFCISTTIGTAGAQSTEKDSSAKCLASCALCAMSRVKKQIYFDTGKEFQAFQKQLLYMESSKFQKNCTAVGKFVVSL